MKMLQYTVKRFVIMLFTLFIIATATFFLLAATPGDALSARVEKLPDSVAARMYAKYGLDKPVMERYVITMKGLVHGDFGESIIYEGQTVQSIIKEKAPISARLGIQQMLLGVSLGLALGVLAAVKKGSFWDYLVVALSILLISVPNLVFALLLQQVFAGKLGWFPVIGWPSDHLWTSGELHRAAHAGGLLRLHRVLCPPAQGQYAGCHESGLHPDCRVQGPHPPGGHPAPRPAQLVHPHRDQPPHERGHVHHRLVFH